MKLAIFIITIIVLGLSCSSKPTTKVPVSYPNGWPVQEFVAPDNSYRLKFVTDGSGNPVYTVDGQTHFTNSGEKLWLICFGNDSNHNDILDDSISELTNNGWRIVSSQNKDGAENEVQIYYLQKPGSVYHIRIEYEGYMSRRRFIFYIFQFHGT